MVMSMVRVGVMVGIMVMVVFWNRVWGLVCV